MPEHLEYRPVQERDLPLICAFARDAADLVQFAPASVYPLTIDALREKLRHRLEPTVVLQRGEVVGFADFYHFRDGKSCFIGNLVVHPDRRGQGIGRYLIGRMLNIAFNRHRFEEVRISCYDDNPGALRLYRKTGFTVYAMERDALRRDRTVVLVHLRMRAEEYPAD